MELFNFHFANLKNKQLNYNHFTNVYNCSSGIMNHHNYPSCKVFIENLLKTSINTQLIIMETGTMSINKQDDNENSINSTLLFNNIVSKYGGILFSCDIDKNKIVVAPRQWFANEESNKIAKNLIPNRWKKI
jgi:hypothetical protein